MKWDNEITGKIKNPMIQIKHSADTKPLPFDIYDYRTFPYGFNDDEVDAIKEKLCNAIDEIESDTNDEKKSFKELVMEVFENTSFVIDGGEF